MGLDYTPPSFSGGLPTAIALTQAFADIHTALLKAVSIDGAAPNAMEEDFDLNGHSLLNVGNVDDLFNSAETTALATRLTAAELALDLFQVSQNEQDAALIANSDNITANGTDITSLLSEVTALVLSQATQDLLLQSHTADLVTINTRAQAALDKAALNELSILALDGRVNTLEVSGGGGTIDLTAVEASITTLESSQVNQDSHIPYPAGAGNTSRFVYEIINNILYRAMAIPGSEDLDLLLSDTSAGDHWYMEAHGLLQQFNPLASHLYREGMYVLVDSTTGVGSKVYRVKAGATLAQLLINPTDVGGDDAYERWSFE